MRPAWATNNNKMTVVQMLRSDSLCPFRSHPVDFPNWPQVKSSQADSLSALPSSDRQHGEGGAQAGEGEGPNSKLHSCLAGFLTSDCASDFSSPWTVHCLDAKADGK